MRMILMIAVLTFWFAPLAWSIEKTPTATSGVTEVGNKFCPVSGDKVSGKHFVEYQGKKYGLCCPMCEKDFKRDPKKYIAKMAKQEVMFSENKGNKSNMKM